MESKELLRVQNLTTLFENGETSTIAVSNVSFSLDVGETLAIVGESGSGKSVTALSVIGLTPAPGRIANGSIFFQDDEAEKDLLKISKEEMRAIRGKQISMIFQEPMTSLNPVLTCGKQVSEVLRRHLKMNNEDAKRRTVELFKEVQLPRPDQMFDQYPHQISGGQKQRVMIAMAIACHPKILIADEPTTALDVTVQKAVLKLLKNLQNKYRMSILFITHDLGLVAGFADKVLVMYKGSAVEEGMTGKIFIEPKHPYTQGLLSCRPPLSTRPRRLAVVEDYISGKTEKTVNEYISKEEREIKHSLIFRQKPILQVKNLSTWFGDEITLFGRIKNYFKAVDSVSFEVFQGETFGIVGESGCGKTTLGRTLLRLIEASSGDVFYSGKNLRKMSRSEMRTIRKEIQMIFQDPYSSLNPRIMVGDAVMEPMRVHQLHENEKQRREKAIELLDLVGIEKQHFYRYPHEFSGGQRQRICIARALVLEPKLIICDESVSALDVSVQAQVLNLMNDLKEQFGFSYIFISHDLSVVRYMSDRIMVMKEGRIEEIGEADHVFQHPEKTYTKTLLSSIP